MWKWKRSSVVKNEPQNSLVLFILRCCINCMESKMDLSHLMIRTFLFLLQICLDQYFVRSHPHTDAVFPSLVFEQKVTGTIANEPILHVSYVSGLLSEVRLQIFQFRFNNNERKHAVDAMLLRLHFLLLSGIIYQSTKSKFISYLWLNKKQKQIRLIRINSFFRITFL